jgi:AraC family transcriptional regulator
MTMLRDTDEIGRLDRGRACCSSQTAFAAAFRKLTGETASDWRKRMR